MPDEPRTIEILDTTLRDGEQTQRVSFAPGEKLSIAQAMLQLLRVNRLEIASARVSRGELEAVSNILEWAELVDLEDRIEVLGFVDHQHSVNWLVDAGGHVINLLAKGSEKHCMGQLRKTLEQHVADVQRTLDYAYEKGLRVNLYLEDWSNGYRESRAYVYRMLESLQGLRIEHFMLPDTLGVMTPEQVYASVADMRARFPDCHFDFHPHNDYGLATANCLAAARAGAAAVHCTVNCLGERAGNASLAEVVVNLKDHLGMHLDIDERHIGRVSRMVENFSGKSIGDNAPIVGEDVFTQTSGIHADGDKKSNLYQTRLRPERFGRQTGYALGKLSGKASVLKNLEMLDITLSPEDQDKLLQRVVELGDSKKSVTSEDLPFIIAEVLESRDYNNIELLNCSITSGFDLESTSSIRIRINDEVFRASGTGNGGFDAFMEALQKVLHRKRMSMPQLADFEIRIPRGGTTSALTEAIITWDADGSSFKTRGVDSNQVFASIKAAIRMLNVQMNKGRTPTRQ
jgi:D-citramalate synthase